MIVLQYIKNTSKRLQTFVSNRVAIIHDGSEPHQWRYVDTKSNPADDVSRGLDAASMVTKEQWKNGPQFLWEEESSWPVTPESSIEIPDSDAELKARANVCTTDAADSHPLDRLIEKYSDWFRLKKAVVWLLRFIEWLGEKARDTFQKSKEINVQEIQEAERLIVAYVQRRCFPKELECLRRGKRVAKTSPIHSLEPVLDPKSNILKIGGRLQNASISEQARHPVILPRDHYVSELIIRHIHGWAAGHSGREHVMSLLRQKYWIPRVRVLINRVVRECIICKRLRGAPGVQQMSPLPQDRVTPCKPPFTSVGVDCFGPFYVKRGRGQEKRYGCLFTCLTTRAIHLEKLHSLDTDSFINGLMRFTSRRGTPERIRSDNGTNFVGGHKELRAAVEHWNESHQTKEYLLLRHIEWEFNPPTASHMGGVWERQIRTVRKVLTAILRNQVLDDERLETVFCEVESIVNSRPLTPVSSDPKDMEPLTPNHLLLLRAGPSAPPGKFTKDDIYSRRWRHVQFMADHFWKRWLREYLPLLQLRQKWLEPKQNLTPGDIVLLMDETVPRKTWPLGRVVKTFPGRDGLVRSAEVKTKWNMLTRPVTKLCLLETISK